jgi:hypothetical protein
VKPTSPVYVFMRCVTQEVVSDQIGTDKFIVQVINERTWLLLSVLPFFPQFFVCGQLLRADAI